MSNCYAKAFKSPEQCSQICGRIIPGIFLAGFISLFIFTNNSTWAAKEVKEPDDVIATINGRSITLGEFNQRYQVARTKNLGIIPDRQSVLKDLVYFELAVQEAKKQNLDKDLFVKNQYEAVLYQALMRTKLQSKIDGLKIDENEIKAYYEKYPLIRTSHIIFLIKPEMDATKINDRKVLAQQVLQVAKSGKTSFSELVKKYSEGPEVANNGDLGYGAGHKLLPEYYDAALKIKDINGISPELVYSIYGFHIIKLTGKKPFKEITPDYKMFIENILKEEAGKGVYLDYFKQLEASNKVNINETLVQKLNTDENKATAAAASTVKDSKKQ